MSVSMNNVVTMTPADGAMMKLANTLRSIKAVVSILVVMLVGCTTEPPPSPQAGENTVLTNDEPLVFDYPKTPPGDLVITSPQKPLRLPRADTDPYT